MNTKSQGWARWVAVATVAGGLALTGAAAGQAAGLPAPSAPSALPAPPAPLSSLLSTSKLSALLTGTTPPALPGASLPAPPSLPLPAPSAPGGGAPSGSTGSGSTAGSKSGSTTGSSKNGPSTSGSSATGSPGAVRATTPVASLCLIPTGSSSPAFDLGLTALGQDLSSPLVQHFPQAFAPCPAGAVSSPGQVLAVDASLNGLLGACVRVTRQVVPVQTTLVMLNHNLIQELTAAGVPLQQLVVPCPAGSGGGAGASATPAGSGSLANSALAGDDLGNPAGQGRLAFTGIDLVPSLALAGALLWFGTLLLRASRRLNVSAVARG
ncbi:hypothetical protein [Pedococcus sp.]|uniref:hypothetical protein n=1 Tax=Pedococcus sp. TaxID=2860345 RepID=UPI002E0EBAF3|nr:hypothetical protein [Pedococcus sp.]